MPLGRFRFRNSSSTPASASLHVWRQPGDPQEEWVEAPGNGPTAAGNPPQPSVPPGQVEDNPPPGGLPPVVEWVIRGVRGSAYTHGGSIATADVETAQPRHFVKAVLELQEPAPGTFSGILRLTDDQGAVTQHPLA